MGKLPALAPKKLIKYLEKNGFVLKRSKGSHRLYQNPANGLRAVVPVHNKDLPKGTFQAILKEAGLDPEDLTGNR